MEHPKEKKVENQPLAHLKFRKHQHGEVANGEDISTRDFRAPYQRNTWSSTDLCNLLHSVREIESQKEKKMALSLTLPQKTLEENKVRISTDHCYCATLTPTEAEITQFGHKGTEHEVSTEVLTPVNCHPVSLIETKERRDKIRRKLFVDENDVNRIERETVGQSLDKNWDMHRKIRITASKCHHIATLQKTTSPSKAIQEILHYKLPQTKAMKEGLVREPFVIEEYTEAKTINKENVVVKPFGLFVSKSKPFLAASPLWIGLQC